MQIVGHAHCVLMAVLCILLTAAGIRTAYLFMICVFFYVGALIINLASRLHDNGKTQRLSDVKPIVTHLISLGHLWSLVLAACQVLPYLYFTYLFHALLVITIPMTSRKGMTANPDLLISLECALGTILGLVFVVSTLCTSLLTLLREELCYRPHC